MKNTKKIEEKLENSSEEEANKLYQEWSDSYGESNVNIPSLIQELNAEHENVLKIIYPYEGEVPEDKLSGEDIKIANKFLDDYGLRIKYVGEGYYEMDVIASFYYDLFKSYVGDDYKEYLRLTAKESEELYASDGGILISAEELGERIASWEDFLEKYPDSDLAPVVDENCRYYRVDYINGMPNTPTMEEDENGKIKGIYEENMKEFNRFIKKYPNSPTVPFIEYFLKNYKNDDIDTKIYDMVGLN